MNANATNANNEQSSRIVIAGGSGFLGINLARHLCARGYRVTILSRSQPSPGPWQHVTWDGRNDGAWRDCLDGPAGLVNLCGRSVDCRKTPENCDAILRSRVEPTRALGLALRNVKTPPSVWLQMSTAHIYGDPAEALCDENSAFGYGLAPVVGKAWERAFDESVLPEQRGVVLRTSFVLGRDGGAFPKLRLLTRMGLGGRAGHGRQGISWIHERDMNRLFEFALTNDEMRGAYVASAPQPVSNADFMRSLRRLAKRPIGLPAASWMIRLGARWIMNTDPELILLGRYCRSVRLSDFGFNFEFEEVQNALRDLMQA